MAAGSTDRTVHRLVTPVRKRGQQIFGYWTDGLAVDCLRISSDFLVVCSAAANLPDSDVDSRRSRALQPRRLCRFSPFPSCIGDFKLHHYPIPTLLAIPLGTSYRPQFTSEGTEIVRVPSTAPRQARLAQDDGL